MFMKRNILFSFLLFVLLGIIGFSISCSNINNTPIDNTTINNTPIDSIPVNNTLVNNTPVTKYTMFEMKPNDVRLKYLNHPLFSFEYPEQFRLVDLNLIPDSPMVYDVSNVELTVKQTNLPEIYLLIRIQKAGLWGYNNANAVFDDWISKSQSNGDNTTTGEITVYGIPAYYIETSGNREEWVFYGTSVYPKRHESFRGAVFNYNELIWSITITWDYHDSEPLELQEYFDHVIETFKILD